VDGGCAGVVGYGQVVGGVHGRGPYQWP
jgi:hypothetical protein